MAGKKAKKAKHPQNVSAVELVRLAQERLQRNQPDEALGMLRRAEGEVQRAGPKPPPHLAALQPRLPTLMARAFFDRALAAKDRQQQLADLKEATRRAPDESRYQATLAVCRILVGEVREAIVSLQPVREEKPLDPFIAHAYGLALLADGQTKLFREQMKSVPDADRDPHLQRLAALRTLLVATTDDRRPGDRPADATDKSPSVPPSNQQSAISNQQSSPPGAFHNSLFRGVARLAAGELGEAHRALELLPPLDASPSRAQAAVLATQLFYGGVTALRLQRFAEAGTDLLEACRLAQAHALSLPWRERLVPYLHTTATGALGQENLSLALACWERVLQLDPDDKPAAANLRMLQRSEADRAWREGERERAIALWQILIDANPGDDELLRKRAAALEQVGQTAEAIRQWRSLAQRWRAQLKARASEAGFRDRLLQLEQHLVTKMLEEGQSPETLRAELEATLKIDPDNHTLRRKYAALFMELGEPRQALKHLEMIERQQGPSADLLVQKAEALGMQGKREQERKTLERAMELEPSHPVARRSYLMVLGEQANAAVDEDDFEEAVAICQRQLAIDPNYTPALEHLADLYFDLGREPDARQTLQRLVDVDPNHAAYRIITGRVYLRNDKPRLAGAEFKRAIELEPSERVYLLIGMQYAEEERWKQAITHLERAAELGSYGTLSHIVRVFLDARRPGDAERFVEMAVAREPDHPEIHLFRAGIAFYRKRHDEALDEVAHCLRLAAGKEEFEEIADEARRLSAAIQQPLTLDALLRQLVEMDEIPGFPPLPPPRPAKTRKRP